MKGVAVRIYAFVLMVTVGQFAATHTSEETRIRSKGNASAVDLGSAFSESGGRFRRQTETTTAATTTTSRPKKNRPANIFSLISVLISETKEDANRAVNEIGTLLNSQFSDSNGIGPKETTTTTPTEISAENGDEDNEVVTTEASVSRSELLGALRSNVQGLVRLFGKEFRLAIKDSNQNVMEFGRDLGTALRPYFN